MVKQSWETQISCTATGISTHSMLNPGLKLKERLSGELDLATRLGTPEFGIRSGGRTNSNLPLSRKLVSGEVIITFITDDTARALVPLFVKKV